mgnify:FL=1
MIGLDNIKSKANEKGITILEALVSTAIIGIGFVAIFQMVQYAVRSIDVSGERTKMSYLVGMVAEDIISDKNSKNASKKGFIENLIDNKNNKNESWVMDTCKDKPAVKNNYSNAYQNKTQKWQFRFSKDRVKCVSNGNAGATNDTKALKVFDICNNRVSGKNCSYRNVDVPSAIYEELYIGKMEAKMNNGKKIKYLYFPIK